MKATTVKATIPALLVAVSLSTACSSGSNNSTASTASAVTASECSGKDPKFVFSTFDDNLMTASECEGFIAEEKAGMVTTGDATAPVWTNPPENFVIDPTTWIVFAWSPGDDGGTDATEGFVVEFRQNNVEILRIMAIGEGWAVDITSWTALIATPGTITATVIRVPLQNGAVDPSEAPVASAPLHFSFASSQ